MHFFEKTVRWVVVVIWGTASILLLPVPSTAAQKNILILHSYDQTIKWTDNIMHGMMDVLTGSDMAPNIHVEYMDTVQHTSVSHLELLETYFREKYSGYHFDVILLSDDPALEFVLHRRELLFPGVPIVFCGANNFDESQIQGETDITGINEDIDIKRTVDLALEIIPDIKQFLVLNDRSETGLLNRMKFEHAVAGFHGGPPSFELLDNFTTTQLKMRLSKLPKDAAVLVIRLPMDGPGGMASPDEYLNFVSAHCRVPVFSLWGMDIDAQVLGGVMADGVEQGKSAAKYAVRILQGEPVSSLPVVMKSPNTAMVDYRQLKRMGITEKVIPEGTQIRFKPETLYDKYHNEILGSLVFVALLMAIIVILYINIVIRKKTEKALLESEKKLSNALEMARLGHWEYDVTENVFKFSDHFFDIFHTTAEAVGGHTMSLDEYTRRFVYPDDLHLVTKEFREAMDATDPRYNHRIEHRMRYPDGSTGYMAVRLFITKDARNRTVRVYGVAQDITELRQAEESIIQSEERGRMILQTAMDGFSLVNREGLLIDVNDAFCRILGYSREELLGMHVSELVVGQTQDQIEANIHDIITRGEDRLESRHRRKDGKIIDTEISIQYRPSEGGLLCAFLRDITEHKQIEARLQQSQKMEAVGTLAGGIAHDFNNILQPMLGFCELLKEDLPAGAPEQSFVNGIFDAALRAKELVHQILAFSRKEDEEAKPTKLQPVIKEAMKLLRSSIPKTVDIQQSIDPDCDIVLADPTQIYQIVMNLCTNAYHAMEDNGGTLRLALTQIHLEKENPVFPEMPPGDYALLKVSDTGIGIPRTILSKIFDPYFTTKEKAKGTGLGLSIVQGIVKRYNGDIRIYSEPGKGTEIHVYLPVMKKSDGNGNAADGKSIPGGSERILLVDDEKPVAEMIHKMLERLGYRVTTHSGSLEAFEAFQSSPDDFDLVITDLTMPHMTGIQLADEMKRIRNDIPVILCTGFSEQVPNDTLNAVGIRAKLAKPVITRALSETVRKVLTAVKSEL